MESYELFKYEQIHSMSYGEMGTEAYIKAPLSLFLSVIKHENMPLEEYLPGLSIIFLIWDEIFFICENLIKYTYFYTVVAI